VGKLAAKPRSKKSGEAWYDQSFRRDYLERYQHRSDKAAAEETVFLLGALSLPPNARVLDLCCGAGRHSRALAESGLRMVALDRSADLLNAAIRTLPSTKNICHVRGDMRRLPLASASLDGVVNLFTSFGYFPGTAENERALREAVRVLKPGAPLVMDFLNIHATLRKLVPSSEKTVGNMTLSERRWHDPRTRRLNKITRFIEGRKVSERSESVRAFTAAELAGLFKKCGLRITGRFGDLTGAPFKKMSSPRCVLIGEKILRSARKAR
jgi:ubiquinone/menaquinone biosynthesis C-methylase UbiE